MPKNNNQKNDNDDFEPEILDEIDELEFDDTEGVSKDKIKQLKDEIKDLKEKVRENLDGWQRERADFTNYKKEEENRRTRMREILEEAITSDFLTTLDNFDMAMSNKEVWESVDQNWRIGIEHIYKQLSGTLEGYGMTKVVVNEGDNFDPEKHMALNQVETDDSGKEDTIAKVIQSGYQMKGNVLRPAKVEVYKLQD
ncbi:nucleotide exchange factor GrpE [Candidatus Parcubacteria bacterium]|nr:nucleotide exchange factor GrpE [Candidatus Parcubacteria bacterium]